MHKNYLEYAGLSEKEALVYLGLLRVTVSTAINLSRKTGLKKSIVYVVLESLVGRGLVREVTIGKRVHYQGESPEMLRTMIREKQSRLDEETRRLDTIISELKSIERDFGERPEIRFFEGREAVKASIHEDMSAESFSVGKNYGIYSYDVLQKVLTEKDIQVIDKSRLEKNGSFKVIYTGTHKVIDRDKTKEAIKIDQERFPILCDIGIFNDDVRIHTLGKKPYGIFLKSKELAITLRSLIDYIFSQKA